MASCVMTREKSVIWLIGQPIVSIGGNKLPSNGDVLRRIFCLTKSNNTLSKSSKIVYNEILKYWQSARIPTKPEHHAVLKIHRLYDSYRALQKNKLRRSEIQIEKESAFQSSLDDLFDIAHANALDVISIQDDKLFLLAQREKGRRGFMSGVDKELANREMKKLEREERQELLKNKEKNRKKMTAVTSNPSNISSSDDEMESGVLYNPGPSTKPTPSCKPKHIISHDLAMALDRTKTTDRNAVLLLSAAATSLGHNIDDVVLSRSTLQRKRKDIRKIIADDIKQTFSTDIPLTVHWDGKIMQDITGYENTERLPILVSGGGMSKLLAVPKLDTGKGEAIAMAVCDTLDNWNLCGSVQAMCFDTTASNTGNKQGACQLIQNKLNKQLLALACRHHINEIIISDVFHKCYSLSTGPDIPLFKRFQKSWNLIDKEKIETIAIDIPWKQDIICICEQHLAKHHSRADYKELLELTIIYLGGSPCNGIQFHQPGALHRARWMARVLYALKIVIFQSQFRMTNQEKTGMKRFALYAIQYYVPSWFAAPLATSAPRTDLVLLKQLRLHEDAEISVVACKALCQHLWYLSEELVSLAFFDEGISLQEKRQMVKSLDIQGSENPSKRITFDYTISDLQEKTIANFITSSSRNFFQKLSLPSAFLEIDPSEWGSREDYKIASNYVRTLNVVNDNAERAVALIQNFNCHLTKNEDQLQYILQVVEKHQHQFPNVKKSTLKAGLLVNR